jgi:outer membrane protein TolC
MRSALLAALALAAFPGAARAEPAVPPEPLTLTLEAAVDLALKENIDVSLAELDLRTFQSRYREVVGAAIPDLSLTGTYTRNFKKPLAFFGGRKTEVGERNSMQGGVELEQTLYSGGKLRAGLKAAKLGAARWRCGATSTPYSWQARRRLSRRILSAPPRRTSRRSERATSKASTAT